MKKNMPKAAETPKNEESREEIAGLVAKKRRENLKRLMSIQERLIERLEIEMDGIKPREILYNVDISNKVTSAMLDRDVPSAANQQGAQVIVNGLSRDEALALISGHKEPKKKEKAP